MGPEVTFAPRPPVPSLASDSGAYDSPTVDSAPVLRQRRPQAGLDLTALTLADPSYPGLLQALLTES